MSFKKYHVPSPKIVLCVPCGGKGDSGPHSCYNCMRLFK